VADRGFDPRGVLTINGCMAWTFPAQRLHIAGPLHYGMIIAVVRNASVDALILSIA